MKAPLILTSADMLKKPNATSAATTVKVAISYVKENNIKKGIVLAGSCVLSNNTARLVFGMSSTEMIVDKKFD